MEYPEIGSIQFASTMHHSDDDMDLCQTEDDDDMNVPVNDSDDDPDTDCSDGDELVEIEDKELLAELRRESLKYVAKDFREEYIYGPSKEQKTFVWSDGTHSWMDKSSGIVWVGVHGTDSICVVTRTGDLDVTRVHGFLKHLAVESVLCKFRKTVISELQDLASPYSQLSESFGHSIPKPFGVVSVILGSDKVHKESGLEALSDEYVEDKVMKVMPEKVESGQISSAEMRDKVRKFLSEDGKSRLVSRINILFKHSRPTIAGYDKKKTTKYLQEQMGRETIKASRAKYDVIEATKFLMEKMEASTVDETVKTAISAFQILFENKKFKAEDIEVSVMDPNYYFSYEDINYKDMHVKHLVTSDIEDHLAAINEPGSGSSSSVGSCSGGSSSEGRGSRSGGPTVDKELEMSDIEEEEQEHLTFINNPGNGGSSTGGSSSD